MHCIELVQSWGWGSVVNKPCSTQNSQKEWPSKSVQNFSSSSDTKQARYPSWGNLPIWNGNYCWKIHTVQLHNCLLLFPTKQSKLSLVWTKWSMEPLMIRVIRVSNVSQHTKTWIRMSPSVRLKVGAVCRPSTFWLSSSIIVHLQSCVILLDQWEPTFDLSNTLHWIELNTLDLIFH